MINRKSLHGGQAFPFGFVHIRWVSILLGASRLSFGSDLDFESKCPKMGMEWDWPIRSQRHRKFGILYCWRNFAESQVESLRPSSKLSGIAISWPPMSWTVWKKHVNRHESKRNIMARNYDHWSRVALWLSPSMAVVNVQFRIPRSRCHNGPIFLVMAVICHAANGQRVNSLTKHIQILFYVSPSVYDEAKGHASARKESNWCLKTTWMRLFTKAKISFVIAATLAAGTQILMNLPSDSISKVREWLRSEALGH